MGVQIYLLDRRTVTLNIGGHRHEIGTLRRSWKVTELDGIRAAKLASEKQKLSAMVKPKAVLVADVGEMVLASDTERSVSAHVVLGWDADRLQVTDFWWDYLPVLGYAIRNQGSNEYVLYEGVGGKLSPLDEERATASGILGQGGVLIRRGQPIILECLSVEPLITNYTQADCMLSDGQAAEILTFVEPGSQPAPAWYIGKRPVDVERYSAA